MIENEKVVKVEGHADLIRDMNNGAIVNNNMREYNKYMTRKKILEIDKNEMKQLKSDMLEMKQLKSDMSEMKQLLIQLLEKK